MGFFKKKNNNTEDAPQVDKAEKPKAEPKKKSDKSIKPRAPKNMAGKKIVRSIFWVFMSLLLLKGAISFAQGNRTINQTIINGNDTPVISDSVKGFAVDFATEYFTWDANYVADRSTRLTNFVKGVDSEMGLKSLDVKGSSKVTSAEIYSTNILDPEHIDVTVVVWRDVQPLPDQIEAAQAKATTPPVLKKKTYMIVPVTLAEEGPVIQEYPRFVSNQQKGDTVDSSTNGTTVGDEDLLEKSKALADSFLRSWYEGKASQLRYFYAESAKSPNTIPKSDFSFEEIDNVVVYKNPEEIGQDETYRIEANVIVKSDIGEPFTNTWKLQVTLKDGRLYVLSNGLQFSEASDLSTDPESISPTSVTPIDSDAPITTSNE